MKTGLAPLGPVALSPVSDKGEVRPLQKTQGTALAIGGAVAVGAGLLMGSTLARWALAGTAGVVTYALLREPPKKKIKQLGPPPKDEDEITPAMRAAFLRDNPSALLDEAGVSKLQVLALVANEGDLVAQIKESAQDHLEAGDTSEETSAALLNEYRGAGGKSATMIALLKAAAHIDAMIVGGGA